MATDTMRLFCVKGEGWNNALQVAVPIEEFIPALSPDQAKQTALRQLRERGDTNRRYAEELRQLAKDGTIDLNNPDPRTTMALLTIENSPHVYHEEQWTATEVTLPDYEIHLVPKP